MSAPHTPGPWQVEGVRHSGDLKIGHDTRLHMVGPDGDAVAAVFYDMATGRGYADARLIAAAPDMLAALDRALPWLWGLANEDPSVTRDWECARDAIAKATGEQQPA